MSSKAEDDSAEGMRIEEECGGETRRWTKCEAMAKESGRQAFDRRR